jgi:transposase
MHTLVHDNELPPLPAGGVALGVQLLPGSSDAIQLDALHMVREYLELAATTTAPTATCPSCGAAATRIHSRYARTLADLPWAGQPVRLRLTVRRFFCDTASCGRTTFTERLPTIVAPSARRTVRHATALTDLALALGGVGGARLAEQQGMPVSRTTLLRLIRRLPTPPAPTLQVIGLDDWAKRKGQAYGSIVVDLERHQPITLLDDRTAETTEQFLRAHPAIQIISRDRASGYASGAARGAPQAIQVADRFHIVKNAREAVEQELNHQLVVLTRSLTDAPPPADATPMPNPAPPQVGVGMDAIGTPIGLAPPRAARRETPAARAETVERQRRQVERQTQYNQMVALQAQGLDQPTIARRIGVSSRTVSRWATGGFRPERKPRAGVRSQLDPYKAQLLARWEQGCQNITHLWREIQADGFAGSYASVYAYLAPLRRGDTLPDPPRQDGTPSEATAPSNYTARQLAFLLIKRRESLTPLEQQDVDRLQHGGGVGGAIAALTTAFMRLVRERDVDQLEGWLCEVEQSPFAELRSLATGIRRDEAAVRAALTLPWSQGQVEGQITKLKLFKRQMYGRAKLDLLQQRMLHAA